MVESVIAVVSSIGPIQREMMVLAMARKFPATRGTCRIDRLDGTADMALLVEVDDDRNRERMRDWAAGYLACAETAR